MSQARTDGRKPPSEPEERTATPMTVRYDVGGRVLTYEQRADGTLVQRDDVEPADLEVRHG